MKKNNRIRLSESQLQNVIRNSIKRVLKEATDSVAPQPFDGDDGYPSEEEISRGNAFYNKLCPWRKWPDAQTLEGLISIAYNLRHDFNDGKYSYDALICDLYDML